MDTMENIIKMNNAGWRLGSIYASGFKASINNSNSNININNREKGVSLDVLGTYTLGEIGYKNNKENQTGES